MNKNNEVFEQNFKIIGEVPSNPNTPNTDILWDIQDIIVDLQKIVRFKTRYTKEDDLHLFLVKTNAQQKKIVNNVLKDIDNFIDKYHISFPEAYSFLGINLNTIINLMTEKNKPGSIIWEKGKNIFCIKEKELNNWIEKRENKMKEMKEMKVIKIIDGSIEKWKNILYKKGKDEGPANCPLCKEYFFDDCQECPIKLYTGQTECESTPYHDFDLINKKYAGVESCIDEGYKKQLRKFATLELCFLHEVRLWWLNYMNKGE